MFRTVRSELVILRGGSAEGRCLLLNEKSKATVKGES